MIDIPLITQDNFQLHQVVAPHLQQLQQAAKSSGIDVTIASGYRSIERQLSIWNEKATGIRPLLDANSQPLDTYELSPTERLFAILRWSALPGFSRHHWGTDFDIFDKSALPPNYQLQLIPQEYDPHTGIFKKLSNWLTKYQSDFFLPYAHDQGGVAPEPWHISFAPVAQQFYDQLSLSKFHQTITKLNIELKTEILQNAEKIFERFILNITLPQ